MSDPIHGDLINAGDRLRALENERQGRRPVQIDDGLIGLREYSQAWYENRSTAYLLRKSWADPINRWFIVAVIVGISVIWTYLLTQ